MIGFSSSSKLSFFFIPHTFSDESCESPCYFIVGVITSVSSYFWLVVDVCRALVDGFDCLCAVSLDGSFRAARVW
jgi:hypothetical protein